MNSEKTPLNAPLEITIVTDRLVESLKRRKIRTSAPVFSFSIVFQSAGFADTFI